MVRDVSIRPARPDEQSMLESLQRRASLGNPGDRDALLANPDAIALPIEQLAAGCVFVAERDGVVAGFAAVVPRPDGGAELDALFVEPHLWKRGIGRRLVDHAAGVARVMAAGFLHVIGNRHAEGFYVSCGFRVTGTVETRFGVGLATGWSRLSSRPKVRCSARMGVRPEKGGSTSGTMGSYAARQRGQSRRPSGSSLCGPNAEWLVETWAPGCAAGTRGGSLGARGHADLRVHPRRPEQVR
jgi:GNAT superfamily N-acetyltransferase